MAGRVIDATLRFIDQFTRPMQTAMGGFARHSGQIERFGRIVDTAGKKLQKMGKKLTASVTLPIAAIGTAAITAGIEFESAFAGVKKTLDVSDLEKFEDAEIRIADEFGRIRQGIIDMSLELPIAATEIAAIAESAGQLGIERENLLSFTRAMSDLSVATNLTSDEASGALARFANITNMDQGDFNKLGATIVDLGNHYATTESDIVSMATRLAGAGSQIGLTEGEIMGFSTALSSVGIKAEMGGSAFSKAMTKMKVATATGLTQVEDISKKTGMSLRDLQLMADNDTKGFKDLAGGLGMTKTELNNVVKSGVELQHFSDIAGMTTDEFKKLFDTDPGKALDSFIQGLGDTKKHGKSTIEMLQNMGFTEVRLRDSLTRMANSSDLASSAMKRGNEAWKDGTALTNEANQRYETTESKLLMLKNNVIALGIEIKEMLAPAIEKSIELVSKFTNWLKNLDEGQKKSILKFAGFAAAAGPAILVLGKITSTIGKTIGFVGKFGGAINKGMIAVRRLGGAGGAFKKFATFGKTALTTLISPAGLVIAAIAAIIVIGILLYKNWDKIKAAAKKLGDIIKNVFKKSGVDTEKLKATFEKLKEGAISVFRKISEGAKLLMGAAKTLIEFLKPILSFIGKVFVAGIKVGFSAVIGYASGLINGIMEIGSGIMTALGGVIDFVTGVFTGNWGKAWNGVKDIFNGVFGALVGLCKTPINGVIGLINGAINGINKLGLTIPDWVPLLGGKEFKINIPNIPMLFKGTNNWKGGSAMIHDKGAEIVDLPGGSRVIPHDKSLQIARDNGMKQVMGVLSSFVYKLQNQEFGVSKNQGNKIEVKDTRKPIQVTNVTNNFVRQSLAKGSDSRQGAIPKFDVCINISDVKVSGYQDVKNMADDIAKEIIKNTKRVYFNMA